MGFIVNRTVSLEFEGYMAGAEVKLKAAAVGVMLDLREMNAVEAVPLLLAHLIEWNLEYEGDDGTPQPVPHTEEGVLKHLERDMIYKIVGEWFKVATGASAPLDPPSDDGQPSPDTDNMAPSMTMEVL